MACAASAPISHPFPTSGRSPPREDKHEKHISRGHRATSPPPYVSDAGHYRRARQPGKDVPPALTRTLGAPSRVMRFHIRSAARAPVSAANAGHPRPARQLRDREDVEKIRISLC
ncbi:hypothetical protein B0H19DRAFT_604702 [Mycena capillaripes]|nr:hypothetical protein B0H19DRAFT_604702 [Mycena capillaripes]